MGYHNVAAINTNGATAAPGHASAVPGIVGRYVSGTEENVIGGGGVASFFSFHSFSLEGGNQG